MACVEDYFQYDVEENRYGYFVSYNINEKEQEFFGDVLNELKKCKPLKKEAIFQVRKNIEVNEQNDLVPSVPES
uniref:Conserved domain protein n=1 Tax=Parastrongyloides trichosuri TaxID=131310 RepID=A0A0N4ZKQ8_PARTI